MCPPYPFNVTRQNKQKLTNKKTTNKTTKATATTTGLTFQRCGLFGPLSLGVSRARGGRGDSAGGVSFPTGLVPVPGAFSGAALSSHLFRELFQHTLAFLVKLHRKEVNGLLGV